MLGEEAVADSANLQVVCGGPRLDGEVALRIHPHRAIVEIGGADAEELVIDDEELRMNFDGDPAATRNRHGIIHSEPVMTIGRAEPAQHAVAVDPHRQLLGVAERSPCDDDDDLGWIRALQALDQSVHHGLGGQILGFDIDHPGRVVERIARECLDLAHGALRGPGVGSSNSDRNVGEERGCRFGPRRRLRRHNVRQRGATGSYPLRSCQAGERLRDRALDDQLHVVNRTIAIAVGRDAARILGEVAAGVPPVTGEIDAADEGDAIVDDDELLVMGGTEGGRGKAKIQTRAALAQRRESAAALAVATVGDRAVPQQQPDIELRLLGEQPLEEQSKRLARRATRIEHDARIEIPADDHHEPAGGGEALRQRWEILRAIEQTDPRRSLDAPAIAAELQDAVTHDLSRDCRCAAIRVEGNGEACAAVPIASPSPSLTIALRLRAHRLHGATPAHWPKHPMRSQALAWC